MEFKQVLIISSLKFLIIARDLRTRKSALEIIATSELRRMYGTCRAKVAALRVDNVHEIVSTAFCYRSTWLI